MNLLDLHATSLKTIIFYHGRPVKFIEPDGTEHDGFKALWNDVEHVLKLEGFTGSPMGERDSIYIDRDSLDIAGILPERDWKAVGAPNKYDPDQTYILEIPKGDKQLPGELYFLTQEDEDATNWPTPSEPTA